MPTKGILKGGKISNKHSTLIPRAEKLIAEIKEFETISKIVLSEIIPVKAGEVRLKFTPVPAGFRLTVRGGSSQQTLYIYCSEREETKKKIEEVWKGLSGN